MVSEDLIIEAKEFFEIYKQEIGKAVKEGKKSVQISFQDIASHSTELAEMLIKQPEETIQILELALAETQLISNARVRLLDLPQTENIQIRNIRSKHLNHLICFEGLVRIASDVRPKVVNAKFECPNCGSIISVLQIDEKFSEPNRCSCGRKGNFKLLSKDMVDVQRITVEESPDTLVGSQQPRRINVYLKEDLVEPTMEERTTPGSKVRVIGILKEVPIPHKTGGISTRFDLAIEANNIIPLEETFEELNITEEDERQIQEIAADPQLFLRLRESIAPSVYGYDEVKEALALQLFSGWKRQREDGTSSRGDIHILLVGDPGVAKSVLLKFMAGVSPKGRYVSGKSVTGAGLTATVVRDEFLRGWSLEAGTMVLSHKGLCAIDELEDMSEEDRSAMHEAMEQQTVTISKANVHATLKAETSVLAAGNPKFGRFDLYQPIAQQINIDAALLTRFDLIFIMKDLPERSKDEAIATHVLMGRRQDFVSKRAIEPNLLKKYVAYAKQKIFPELTDKAMDEIKKFYVELRNRPTLSEDLVKPIPITARQLEAMIRLSEAVARARLSKKVTREDARRAIDLLKFCLMQVGFDEESKQIDIDKISTGVTASQRSKIILVREAITRLESRLGKLIPIEEVIKELGDKMDQGSIEEAIEKLALAGDIFKPKKGFIQRM
ncbi:MAG: minichromosome maintenance protein MCM [Candidatus Pacearchaeota archaeon]